MRRSKSLVAALLLALGSIATFWVLGQPEDPQSDAGAALPPDVEWPAGASADARSAPVIVEVAPEPAPESATTDSSGWPADPYEPPDDVPAVADDVAPPPQPEVPASSVHEEPPATLDSSLEPLTLSIPVEGVSARHLTDTFTQARGQGRLHDAIDIMAPRGTPVRAAADGRIVKLFTSVPGGLTVYQFDVTATHVLYYAHLDSYAPGLAEGQILERGDPIGEVGSTGNAIETAPHLHFSVQILGPEKRWWKGTPVNPYPLLMAGAE